MIRTALVQAAKLLVPVGMVAARLLLDEGLTEAERLLQSVLRKGAERFLQAHPKP